MYIAVQSFLIGSKHLKNRDKVFQSLCLYLHALNTEELNVLLLIDCYYCSNYSFLIQQLTKKREREKRKSFQKSNNWNYKILFSKNNLSPKHSRQKPLTRERCNFLHFHFVCGMSALPGDLWLLFQERSNDNGRWIVFLIKKCHSVTSASLNSKRRGLFPSPVVHTSEAWIPKSSWGWPSPICIYS